MQENQELVTGNIARLNERLGKIEESETSMSMYQIYAWSCGLTLPPEHSLHFHGNVIEELEDRQRDQQEALDLQSKRFVIGPGFEGTNARTPPEDVVNEYIPDDASEDVPPYPGYTHVRPLLDIYHISAGFTLFLIRPNIHLMKRNTFFL